MPRRKNGHANGHKNGNGNGHSYANPNELVLAGGLIFRKGRFDKVDEGTTMVRGINFDELRRAWEYYERDRLYWERGGKTRQRKHRTAGKKGSLAEHGTHA